MSRPPKVQWHAPGRVNLIGDHTDYCGGFVLPMALDRECVITVAPGAADRVNATSLQLEGVVDVAADGRDDPRAVEPSWGRFVAGAVQAVTERGVRVPALDLEVSSTVPAGSGLSSSSALAVALTLALADAGGVELDRRDAARVALDAEVRAVGVPGGLMDQLASLFGQVDHALLIDCRSLDIEAIPIPDDIAVLVAHCGLPRTLADSEYAERRAACERAAAALGVATLRNATIEQVRENPRARHVVTENARVLACADALRANDLDTIGALMLASHASLRDDFEVSTPQLDLLVELLVEAGAAGARLTGAGFGGCAVGVARSRDAHNVLARAADRYQAASGLEPTVFIARAGPAAGRTLIA
ncbi:MAG: galactokinase [Acidimicrobiia bacterium]|nr:galactokinase [Acidimicrobiia bacterium]